MAQTLIVTIDVTGKSDAAFSDLLAYLFATPVDKGTLKYNLVDIEQNDFIAAEHAVIDIIHRAQKSGALK